MTARRREVASRHDQETSLTGYWAARLVHLLCLAHAAGVRALPLAASSRWGCAPIQEYTDRMKGLLTLMPDGRYKLKSFATDDVRESLCAYGVF